jgi:hypothetical protein
MASIRDGIGQAYRPPSGRRYRAAVAAEARNPIQRRWEALPGPLQFLIAFLIWFVIFWVGHVKLLNQPVGRGFLYGIFWGGTFSLLTLLATRSEQTKRHQREHPEDSDAH